jgi:preprotein translocase subunit SecF
LFVYLAFRFEWKMAASAIIAVLHDIIITAGVYSLTAFEVTPATVIAFLTILGFSLYDTVVVFDKVKENEATLGSVPGDTYSLMVNRSLNQVLMRSLNTTLVALLPVGSLLIVGSGIFGAVTLRDFALALFVGLAVGAYSSIFVATPILAWWKEKEEKHRALRERSAKELARADARAAAAASAVAAVEPETALEPEPVPEPEAEPVATAATERPGTGAPARTRPPAQPAPRPAAPRPSPSGVTPRPRQQRRKKRK